MHYFCITATSKPLSCKYHYTCTILRNGMSSSLEYLQLRGYDVHHKYSRYEDSVTVLFESDQFLERWYIDSHMDTEANYSFCHFIVVISLSNIEQLLPIHMHCLHKGEAGDRGREAEDSL